MDARHVVHFAPDRTDLIGLASVGTDTLVDDHGTKLLFFHRLDDLRKLFAGRRKLEQRFDGLVFLAATLPRFVNRNRGEGRFALLLVDDAHRAGNVFAECFAHPLVESRIQLRHGILALGLSGFFRELVDRLDDLANLGVRELDCAQEVFLGDLLALALDHHDGVGRAGDHDVHAAGFVLRKRWIADVVAALVASDAHCGDGLIEGNIAERQRCARGAYAEHVRIELGIDREHGGDNLDVVAETIGKERANGAVDLSRADHRML